jgi:biofilm PGA synthesis N-glycosyltransferase PgaC
MLVYLNYLLSVVWSFAIVIGAGLMLAGWLGWRSPLTAAGVSLLPTWWGALLASTYVAQAFVSHHIEWRYERDMLKSLFWIVWYPLAFWMISTLSTLRAIPKVLLRKDTEVRGTWVSPDRGFR